MKKKNLRPLILSSLAALAVAGIGTGATFALFTDKAETDVSITAGIVKVSGAVSDLTTYSVQADPNGDRIDENGGKYSSVATTVPLVFATGGTASYDQANSILALDRIVPGDRVTFNFTPSAESNVDILYRFSYKVIVDSTHNLDLAKGLVTTIGSETYDGLQEYTSVWTKLEADASEGPAAIPFDIELPVYRGNEYQNKSAAILLNVEGIQANAAVANGMVIIANDATAQTETKVADEDLVIEASNADNSITVKSTIPAATSEVSAGSSVALKVSEISITENPQSEDSNDLNFDASLYVDGIEVNSFDQDIAIEVSVGSNLRITSVTHNGEPLTNYSYNPDTGIVSFVTRTFSPFVITYEARNGVYGFYDSYQEAGHWVHEIKTKEHFRNIGAAAFKHPEVATVDSVYKVVADIDFGGISPWSDGSSWVNIGTNESPKTINDFEFNGILDGGNHKLSNISITQSFGAAIGDADFAGLFDRLGIATLKNFTVKNVTVNNPAAKPGAIIAGGTKSAASEVVFENVTVDESCRVDGLQGCAAFMGYARAAKKLHFVNCVNKADIVCTGQNVGAFMGSLTGGSAERSILFDHCVNSGDISAQGLVGSFYGSNSNNGTVTFDHCENTGDVTAFANANAGLFVGQYHSLSNFTFTETTNSGTLYACNASGELTTNGEFIEGNTTWASYDVARGYIQPFDAITAKVRINETTKKVEVYDISNPSAYDSVLVSISLGPIDTFRLSDSGMFASGGDTVATETVSDVANISLKQLTRAGWFAPTADTPTGAFDGDGPSSASIPWFDYYKIPFELKGTTGYENGYHVDEQGGYYIISNENCVDSFKQIMNGHTSVEYRVVFTKVINNKPTVVGFASKTDSIYPNVGLEPNPLVTPYYQG